MRVHSPGAMLRSLEKVGLVCEKLNFWINTEEFKSENEYSKYVAGWLPHLYHLKDNSNQYLFLKEVVKKHYSPSDRNLSDKIIVKDTQVEVWISKPAEPAERTKTARL